MKRIVVRLLHLFAATLYRTGLHRVWIRWVPGPRIILLHGCEPEESLWIRGLASNNSPTALAALADFAREHYTVVTMDRLEEEHAGRVLALTFDDGYRSLYTHALPVLKDRGVPATVYLIGETIDTEVVCWVNRLNRWVHTDPARATRSAAESFGGAGEAETVVDTAIARYSAEAIEAVLDRMPEGIEPPERIHLNRAEIEEMVDAGWRFGNHTVSHPNLALLTPKEAAEEIEGGFRDIADLPGTIPSLAYPFGHHTEEVREIAIDRGAESIVEVGGWNFRLDPTRIARIPVYCATPAEIFAEIEVIGLIKGWMKRAFR